MKPMTMTHSSIADVILDLENEHLRFVLRADASSAITVKATGIVWRQGPVAIQEDGDFDQHLGWVRRDRPSFTLYPGRFAARREADLIHFEMTSSPGARRRGSFCCRYRLDGPWLELELTRIDDSLPSLVFPTPFESDALLVPSADTIWRERARNDVFRASKWEWHFFRNPHWNMRWFGGLRGPAERHGWIAIVSEGYEDAGVLASGVFAAPVWMRSLDTWQTRRKVRYGFTTNGYVGLAKLFRGWAQESGLWGVSLREKLDATPNLACMIGGRKIRMTLAYRRVPRRYEDIWDKVPAGLPPEGELVVNLDFRAARRLADSIKAAGMKKGVFKYGGWGKGGYDERHPDIWPPEVALGSLAEFTALCREDPPYLTCLHDNYYDVYEQSPGFPAGTCKDPAGHPMRVGYWHGGQAYAANSREMYPHAVANARRMWEAGCRSHYFDTFAFLSQSFEPGNTLTRTEDREWKNRIFDASQDLGLIVGSESGCDFYVAHTHWSPKGVFTLAGGRVPLWSLVFHDAHLGMRGVNAGPLDDPAALATNTRRRLLENMLQGFGTTFVFNSFAEWEAQKELFGSTFFADRWHEEVALSEMIDHQILSEDGAVRRTVFANGRAITANLADSPRESQAGTLAALEYRLD